MTTDVLSDVLRAVHLTGALFFDFDLTSPWVLAAPDARASSARSSAATSVPATRCSTRCPA